MKISLENILQLIIPFNWECKHRGLILDSEQKTGNNLYVIFGVRETSWLKYLIFE